MFVGNEITNHYEVKGRMKKRDNIFPPLTIWPKKSLTAKIIVIKKEFSEKHFFGLKENEKKNMQP